jgi:hypothetical protein
MKLKPADFAREAGVSRQAIFAKIKNSTLMVDSAGFLDTDNPINSAYISDPDRKRRQAAIAPPMPPAGTGTETTTTSTLPPIPASLPAAIQTEEGIAAAAGVPAKLLSLTLRELVVGYNGLYNLEKHARTLRELVVSAEKEQRMQERGLKLIERDFVTSRLFQYIDVLMRQIIEYPESAADAIVAKIMSEGPDARGDLVFMMRDNLGRIIAGAKDQIIKELNGLRGKYQKELEENTPEAVNEAL